MTDGDDGSIEVAGTAERDPSLAIPPGLVARIL